MEKMRIVFLDNIPVNFLPYYITDLKMNMKKIDFEELKSEIDYYYYLIREVKGTLVSYIRDPNIANFLSSKLDINIKTSNKSYTYEPGDRIYIITLRSTEEPVSQSNLIIYKIKREEDNDIMLKMEEIEDLVNLIKQLAKACQEKDRDKEIEIANRIEFNYKLSVDTPELLGRSPAVVLDYQCKPYLFIPKVYV